MTTCIHSFIHKGKFFLPFVPNFSISKREKIPIKKPLVTYDYLFETNIRSKNYISFSFFILKGAHLEIYLFIYLVIFVVFSILKNIASIMFERRKFVKILDNVYHISSHRSESIPCIAIR
jgi:hypothetical protein